jgi:hypothetical protein
MGKRGLQREMDSFFRGTENEEFSIRRITKGGFSNIDGERSSANEKSTVRSPIGRPKEF